MRLQSGTKLGCPEFRRAACRIRRLGSSRPESDRRHHAAMGLLASKLQTAPPLTRRTWPMMWLGASSSHPMPVATTSCGSAAAAGRVCRYEPLRSSATETAIQSFGQACKALGSYQRSGQALPGNDRSALCLGVPSDAPNPP
jgi:hypothetical protein